MYKGGQEDHKEPLQQLSRLVANAADHIDHLPEPLKAEAIILEKMLLVACDNSALSQVYKAIWVHLYSSTANSSEFNEKCMPSSR